MAKEDESVSKLAADLVDLIVGYVEEGGSAGRSVRLEKTVASLLVVAIGLRLMENPKIVGDSYLRWQESQYLKEMVGEFVETMSERRRALGGNEDVNYWADSVIRKILDGKVDEL